MNLKEKISNIFWVVAAPIRFIQNHFKAVLLVVVLLLFFVSSDEESVAKENLYKIELSGPILESDSFLEELEKAKTQNIKGLLMVVNSPGGAVSPSVEIMMAIREYAKTRPVVVYSAGLLASGSYYASIYAHEIIANPASIVGSIGVLFETVNTKELLDKVGIKPQVVKSGKYKEVGAFYRDWEAHEKEALETLSDDIYKMFVLDVANARKLDVNNSSTFADGRVFISSKAKDIGLIDSIGSIDIAKRRIIELSRVQNPVWNKKSEIDLFFEKLSSETTLLISKSLHSALSNLN